MIDFTKLAKVDGTKLVLAGPARLSAQVPGKVRDVANFYLAQFAKLGWKRGGRPSDQLSDEYASATLIKDGHLIEMSAYTSGDRGEVSVSLISHANFDARALPRVEEAKLLYGDQAVTSYVTLNKLPDEAEAVFKALVADGWQPYSRLHAGKPVAARDRHSFELRKRGYSLDVTVDVAPAQNNQTFVQYAVYALSHELPTPPEATNVEFDDDRWELQCKVPGEFRTAAEFYRKAMPDLGYKPLPGEDPRDTYWNLRFGTAVEDVVLVQSESTDGKTTLVSITGIPAAAMAEMNRPEGAKSAPAAERP